ncbi:MAG: hypothetical protein WCS52_04830 [bacterium]
MNIIFTTEGVGRCLYTEAILLERLGKLSVERASQVEFDNRLQAWRVSVEGSVLFCAPTRQQCLDWERQYFERQEELRHGG